MATTWKPYTPPGETQAEPWQVKYVRPEDRPGGKNFESNVPRDNYGYQENDYSQSPQVSTYWHDPTNVAKYYNQIQSNQYADWMDDSFVNFINQAYGLYEIANDGANWEEWKPLQLNDPARQFLGSFDAPPEDIFSQEQEEQPYPEVVQQNYTTGGLTQEEWDALPWTQKALYGIFSSPQTAGAAIGGTLGIPGGPVGIAAGAGLGAGLGTLADKFPWLSGAFDKLDILAEGVERFLGAASLVTGGDVRSFDDLADAWKAGHLFYDVARIKDEQIVDLLEAPQQVEWTDEELIYEAYTRIRKGEDVNQVYESIQERTGFSGQMRDLMGHIVFDPLNFAGYFALKGGGALAKLMGASEALTTAFDAARGITDVVPKYGEVLRATKSLDELSDLDRISRWAAQVDDLGKDLRYAQPEELTGIANVGNKLGGAVTTGAITSIIGAGFFGVPGALIAGGLGAVFGAKRGLSYIANLTPAAKAMSVTDEVSRFSGTLLSKNTTVIDGIRTLDKHAFAKQLKSLANTPRELAAELSMKMFNTPDAAAMPLFFKESIGKIDNMVTTWDNTGTLRTALRNISDATGKSVDDVIKMLRDSGKQLKKGASEVTADVNKLDILYKQIDEAARKTNNEELVRMIDDGAFNKDTLAEMFDVFVKGDNAATETAWLSKAVGTIIEDSALNAAKWFDVKPEASIIRMSTALKNAQSLALLGLNPNYLVNNFVNNMVTMASDGVLGFRTTKQIDNFWARVGVEPPRLRQGVTALGDTEAGNKAILEAQRTGDWIDKFGGKSSSLTKKLGIMSNASQGMEAWSSAQSMTVGFKRAWDKLWRPGKGFDPLPGQLQQALGPEMTDYIHSAIRRGLNKAEIEDALWSGYSRKMSDDFMPAVAERLGMRPDDARGILRDLGIEDFLRDGIKDSSTSEDIIKVFDEAYKMVDDQLDNMLKEYSNYYAEHLKTKLGLSGSIEFIDTLANNSTRLELAEIERWRSNSRIWELLEANPEMTPAQTRAIWSDHYLRQAKRYGRYETESIAELKAVVESIDGADDLGKGLIDSNQAWHDNWKGYYQELKKLQEKTFKDGYSELSFENYERQALELYKKHVKIENDTEVAINAWIEQLIRRQHGDAAGDATIAWRTKMIEMRQQMRDDMIRLREQLPGKSHADRSRLWRDFIGPHTQKIHDYHAANFDDANGVYDATRAAGGAQTTPNAGVSMPMGFGDSFQASPALYDIFEKGWSEMAVPLLEELRNAMLSGDARFGETLKGANIDPATMSSLREYLGTVYSQMGDVKNMAVRFGEDARDFALLNYTRRTGLDTMLTAVMPYQFWYSRSMLNWAKRALDRPGYIATWGRLHAAQQQNERKQGYPSRLAGKIQIEMPFLPEWMGGNIFIDPMRQAFPIELLLEPFQKMAEDSNAIESRTRYILEQWHADDKYTKAELEEALKGRTGAVWEEAVAQAKVEVESEFNNPMDFMTAISGTLLPIQWAYEMIQGRPEQIGSLPVTRAIQALTSWATPGGVNIEAPIRKALGLPVDGNEYQDYYIRREIVWAGMMNGASYEEMMKALVDRTGPLYETALDYVGRRQSLRYFTSSLALDFFPEGEQEIRGLHEEFRAALEADKLGEFFDKHPEYNARSLSFMEEPEDMIRKIAVSAIWEMRDKVPTLTKNRLEAAFGEEYQTSFLNKDTRSIDSIDTETLLSWAQALGAELPEKVSEYNIPQVMADTGSPAENQILDWYYQQREQLFGANITDTQTRFYALPKANQKAFLKLHPELQTYWDWNKGVKQQYPRLGELTKEKYERENLAKFEIDVKDISPPLNNRLLGYFYSGQPLEYGARSELNRLWNKYGKPTETLDQFIELLRSYIYSQ
jgi:hypothetical protein